MVPPEQTSAIVPGLEEGNDYEFRVVPVNAAGPGEASDPTASIFTKTWNGEASDPIASIFTKTWKGLLTATMCGETPVLAAGSLTRTNCLLLVML